MMRQQMSDQKTIADVLDHGIDKLSGGAAEIAKAVKTVAPHAWELAVRQQITEGTVDFALAAVALIALAVAYRPLRKISRERMKTDGRNWTSTTPNDRSSGTIETGRATTAGIALIALLTVVPLVSVLTIRGSLMQLGNPEYYAAKEILGAIK